nr:MAG TPA: hypothetical protein [Caudoviricetes sp.]
MSLNPSFSCLIILYAPVPYISLRCSSKLN